MKQTREVPFDPWCPFLSTFSGWIWKATSREGEASLYPPAVLSRVWLGKWELLRPTSNYPLAPRRSHLSIYLLPVEGIWAGSSRRHGKKAKFVWVTPLLPSLFHTIPPSSFMFIALKKKKKPLAFILFNYFQCCSLLLRPQILSFLLRKKKVLIFIKSLAFAFSTRNREILFMKK